MTNFKVGDKVKITGNTNNSCNKVGDIGLITEINPICGNQRVQVEGGDNLGNWTKTSDMELVTTSDVPIGYVGLPKDMNLKDGDKVKGAYSGKTYVIDRGRVGVIMVNDCHMEYQLISRASKWVFTDTPDYTTHDVATHKGMPVAARKKSPVVETVVVRVSTDTGFSGSAIVKSTNGVIDWSTLTVD
jgi:hypothetical protein